MFAARVCCESLKFLDVPNCKVQFTNEKRFVIDNQNVNGKIPIPALGKRTFMNVEVLEIEIPDPIKEKSQAEDEMEKNRQDEYFVKSAMNYLNKFTTDEKINIKIEILKMIQNKMREKDQQTSSI